jgi:hypothetical protein
MKKIVLIILFSIVPFLSVFCGTRQIKDVDLTTKGLIKARVIIREDSTTQQFLATTLFFKKLDDAKDLAKGKIISSEIHDGDSIVINYEPGMYVIIAAMSRSHGQDSEFNTRNLVCFDEYTMNVAKVNLKAGDSIDIGDLYIIENTRNFMGTVSKIQDAHRLAIASEVTEYTYTARLGALDRSMYPKLKEKEKAEKEKDKQTIEKFE